MTWLRPYGTRVLLLILGASALLMAGVSSWVFLPSFASWDLRDLVSRLKLALPVWAVPLGWLAVWAMRVHEPDSVLVGPAPSKPRSQIVARQIGLLAGAVLAGSCVGVLPAAATLAVSQYFTSADVVALAAVVVGVASLIPVAACVATLVDIRLGLLLAPLVVLAVLLVPAFVIQDMLLLNRPASIMSVAYVWSVPLPERGQMLVWQVELLRVFFFSLLGFAALKTAEGLCEWRASRRTAGLTSAAWFAIPAVVAVIVGITQPLLALPDPNDQVGCEDSGGMMLCLYQIDEPQRDSISASVTPLIDLLHGGTERPITVTQDWRASQDNDALTVDRLRASRREWLEVTLNSLTLTLLSEGRVAPSCDAREDDDHLEDSVAHQIFTRAAASSADPEIAAAYTQLASERFITDPEADARLTALSDGEFSSWFTSQHTAIASCQLTHENLP